MNYIILPNVIETDFDDIKNIIKDRLKKEEIKSGFSVSWHDDSILISDMTEEAFQAILDEFLNLEIYGTPQFDTEEKLEKTEIEKVITEEGEGGCDSGSMDGALTTANVATYDSPFEIPTGFSKKQKAMFKRGVLEMKKKMMKEKIFNIEVEAPTFEEIYIVENEYRWNWDEANEHARNHHFGYSDWRLPTVEELKWIDKHVEINRKDEGWYWSSEDYKYGDKDAYIVFISDNFAGGDVDNYFKIYDDVNTMYVRGNGSEMKESKRKSKRTMKESIEEFKRVDAPTFDILTVNNQRMKWDEAKEYADSLSLDGYTDWRLPTVKELQWIYNNVDENFDINCWTSETASTSFDNFHGIKNASIPMVKTVYMEKGYDAKPNKTMSISSCSVICVAGNGFKMKESKKELNEGFKSYLTNLSDAFKEYVSETSSKGMFTMKTLKDYLLSTFDSYKKYDKNELTEIAKNFIDEWLEKKLIGNVGYESYAFRDLRYESKTLKESELEFDLFDEFKKSAPKEFVIDDFIKFLKNFDETYKKYSTEELRNFTKDFIETWKDADLIDKIDKEKYRIKTIVEKRNDALKESENDEVIIVTDEMKQKYPELKNVSMIQKYPSNDLTYKQALKYAEELKLAGYTDWRLPTFREAKQIAKTFRKEMKLNFAYWTSTRYLNSDPYVVNHRGDNDSTDHELSFYECFCVR